MHLFDLKYALSSCPGQLLESGVKSKRGKREVLELDPPLLNRPTKRAVGAPSFRSGVTYKCVDIEVQRADTNVAMTHMYYIGRV